VVRSLKKELLLLPLVTTAYYNEDHNGNKFSNFLVLSLTNEYCHCNGIMLCIYFIFYFIKKIFFTV